MNQSANGDYSRDNADYNEDGEPVQMIRIRPTGKI